MSSFQVIEILIICLIIAIQCYVFYSTKRKIQLYKGIFPDENCYQIFNLSLKPSYYENHPTLILNKLADFIKKSEPKIISKRVTDENNVVIKPEKLEKDIRENTKIIKLSSGGNNITIKLFFTLNTYLLRNRSIALDF